MCIDLWDFVSPCSEGVNALCGCSVALMAVCLAKVAAAACMTAVAVICMIMFGGWTKLPRGMWRLELKRILNREFVVKICHDDLNSLSGNMSYNRKNRTQKG